MIKRLFEPFGSSLAIDEASCQTRKAPELATRPSVRERAPRDRRFGPGAASLSKADYYALKMDTQDCQWLPTCKLIIRVRCGSGASASTCRVTCTRDASGDCQISVSQRINGQDPVSFSQGRKVRWEEWERTLAHSRQYPTAFAMLWCGP
jgi:hypothetical protein